MMKVIKVSAVEYVAAVISGVSKAVRPKKLVANNIGQYCGPAKKRMALQSAIGIA